MQTIRTFTVKPSLPSQLEDLRTIANNMYWSWNGEVLDLFRRMDYELWKGCHHNPIKMLGSVSQARLEDLARNDGFLYQLQKARENLDQLLNAPSWFDKIHGASSKPTIAYFSAEFGIHESLPIYSGGLGILAGDHLKSASDMGIPLVGIGLMYQKGYCRQYLNTDGWQQEHYIDNDFYNMPVELVRQEGSRPLTIGIQFPERIVSVHIWKATVGRVPLFLLDTNLPENTPEDRIITQSLYGGGPEMRICQEIVLGIGGLKGLFAMGIEPTVCHMNEGHAAFMALERVRKLRSDKGMTFDEAVEAAKSSNIFTVHTPVAAGNDEFTVELMDKYFGHYYGKLGLNREQFLGLGRVSSQNEAEGFKMPVLAIKMSSCRNGVSKLHGEVSQKIWRGIWPDLPESEVPIASITNGIHAKTWISPDLDQLYERYLGSKWASEIVDKSIWQNIDLIPDEEFWRAHQRCKERLIAFARARIKRQLNRTGAYHTEIEQAEHALDPEALTIGFARRFATYKRGNLLLRDPERLIRLLSQSEKPVQFIFAGKAHPRDKAGKEIIRDIVHFAKQHKLRRRFVFLEDYDIDIARYMVQGVDVWLNNPRRPMEASGTSGMKAAVNGALNFSTLDGWWCEGYIPDGGWIIGAGEEYENLAYQDQVESQAIFDLLENEIVPIFYSRSNDRLPKRWVSRMKNTIKWCGPRFNTHRMVADYTRKFYMTSAKRWQKLTAEAMARIRALSMWKSNIKDAWSNVSIESVDVIVDNGGEQSELNFKNPQLEVGSNLAVQAKVRLGKLSHNDVAVQIYYGIVDSMGQVTDGKITNMKYLQQDSNPDLSIFKGAIPCEMSGQHGFAIRLLPKHEDMTEEYEPGMILWES